VSGGQAVRSGVKDAPVVQGVSRVRCESNAHCTLKDLSVWGESSGRQCMCAVRSLSVFLMEKNGNVKRGWYEN